MLPTLLLAAIIAIQGDAEALEILVMQAPGAKSAPAQPEPLPYEGEWVVETVDHIKVMSESRITIRLQRQNISGSASCNTYRGQLTVSGTDLKVGELLRTMKACDQARMSEEQDFFNVLGAVVTYELRGNGALVLSTSGGRTITARRTSPQSRD